MHSRSSAILIGIFSLMLAACEDTNDATPSGTNQTCDTSFTPTCSADLRISTICVHAQITPILCGANETCSTATGLCTQNTNTPPTPQTPSQPTDPTPQNPTPQDPAQPTDPTPQDPAQPTDPQNPTNDLLCDTASYTPTCLDNENLRVCLNGILSTQTCPTGYKCTGKACVSTSTPSKPNITTGNPGEKCDPNTFTERCYGTTEAIACMEQYDANGESLGTYKVEKIDCVKSYGKKYICDIFENFHGDGRDIVGCFSDAEKCSTLGASYSVCEDDSIYEDVEENEYFSTSTYRCVHGVLNDYYYFENSVPCPGNCNKDKTGCK